MLRTVAEKNKNERDLNLKAYSLVNYLGFGHAHDPVCAGCVKLAC
jgi:hypothetical protein